MDKIADLEKQVADQMIEAMKTSGTGWKKHWATPRPAQNALSGHIYSGSNVFTLGMTSLLRGLTDARFITFKQALEMGGNVRKGAKGIPVIFYGAMQKEAEDGTTKARRFAKITHVFSVQDIEGVTFAPLPEMAMEDHARNEAAEAMFHACKVPLVEGTQAFYTPAYDIITMPPLGRFRASKDTDAATYFYGTLFHELIHATGHKSRCARDGITGFISKGSKPYAYEELVAEIGSVMLGQRLGLQIAPRPDNVSYVKGWISLLENDPHTIFAAASDAAAGVRWIDAQQPRKQEDAA